jgi:sugar phosphate isomerase/epimerase
MQMKKTNINKNLSFGLILAIMSLFTACNCAHQKSDIGLQLYSVRDDMKKDVVSTVTQVGKMGYTFIEAAGYNNGQFYNMTPVAFKELCNNNGLEFWGSHTGRDVPNEDNWEKVMRWWDDCIEAHAAAGVKWIVQPWMGKVGYESAEGLKRYCDYFNAVGEKCNAKGIRFGYHNHDKEFTTILDEKPIYDWMLEWTDPSKVMFQMDVYWVKVGGKDPIDYFNRYPGRFENWHLKDKEEIGGSGEIDFVAIYREKEKSGMQYAVVEVEKYNFEPLVSCQKSLEYLKEVKLVQ